jgi:hypothetical protein
MGEVRNALETLRGEPEGARLFGTPGNRWEYNIKMYLKGIECKYVDWIYLAQNRDL